MIAAGDCGGFVDGDVMGGCARRRVLAEAHLLWVRKDPADEGLAGPSLAVSLIQQAFLP